MPAVPQVPELTAAIRARMASRGFTTNRALADAAGLTIQGIAPLLRGERRNYQNRLKWPLCEALWWTHDSIDRILAGGEPVAATPTATDGASRAEAQVQALEAENASLRAQLAALAAELDRRAPKPRPKRRPAER